MFLAGDYQQLSLYQPSWIQPLNPIQWLLLKPQEATKGLWAGKRHGTLILDISCWCLCLKDGVGMDKTEAEVMTLHQRGGGERKRRARDWERQGDAFPHPPRQGVKIQMCQLENREPEKGDIRKAQGSSQCIQYGLNHLGIHRKVHMPINPCRKFRTFFLPPGQSKWRVTILVLGLCFLP